MYLTMKNLYHIISPIVGQSFGILLVEVEPVLHQELERARLDDVVLRTNGQDVESLDVKRDRGFVVATVGVGVVGATKR